MLVTETGTVTLSKEFKEVTPPRTERQLENRKDFLLECGHIFPFLTCHGILVDDYDDYAICKKCGIPFETAEMGTEIKDEVISRIVYKQLNLGHLTPFQRCEILLRNQKALKATADWRGYDFPADFAKIAGVSQKTLDLVKEMLSLDYKNEDLLNLVRDERVSISRAHDKLMEEAEMNGLKNDLNMALSTSSKRIWRVIWKKLMLMKIRIHVWLTMQAVRSISMISTIPQVTLLTGGI